MNEVIAVIGLGYVGLPLAVAFARTGFRVIGYDTAAARIGELRAGKDSTASVAVSDLTGAAIHYTGESADIKTATAFLITVPTPVDAAHRPDLRCIAAAAEDVGKALKKGDLVVLESTVYPGATEDFLAPRLSKISGLRIGVDFAMGYAPERINPGDPTRQLQEVVKVLSGDSPATTERLARLYAAVCGAGNLYRAASIKVAEAAKALENTQRDLNIALVNEMALIADALHLDTQDILAAAATKWNFLPFQPGLVGGHCIGVDPYYLTHKAAQAGYEPEVILAGRRLNNKMGEFVADKTLQLLAGTTHAAPWTVNVLGLTFKENVPDVRNTRVVDVVRRLEAFGARVRVYDPLADAMQVQAEYGLTLATVVEPAAAVVVAVAHAAYKAAGWGGIAPYVVPKGVVADVKGILAKEDVPAGVVLWRL
ncbi:MAG: nucleotide sugar dehydrogenase [Holosporales bacterium]